MVSLKSLVKSVPPLFHAAKRVKRFAQGVARSIPGVEPSNGFYPASPDNLVALVKAFNLQAAERRAGRDLFRGHAYYEFGMFRGFSFWFAEQISRQYSTDNFRHYGFDSFEGLPQPQLPVEASLYHKGEFCGGYAAVNSYLKQWKTDFTRIGLHKGFYSPELFARLKESHEFLPASICLIDADLYESCVPVLDFMRALLVPGSILLFDDFNFKGENNDAGERRALIEFEQRNPTFRKEHLFDYGFEGAAFRVLSL